MGEHNDLHLLIKCIAALKTVKEKVRAIKAANETTRIAEFLEFALDPSRCYYMTKDGLHDMPPAIKPTNKLNDLFALLTMASKGMRGNAAGVSFGYFLERSDKDLRALLEMCLNHQLPGKIGTTIVNTAIPGLIYIQPYGGCSAYDPDKIGFRFNWRAGVVLQEKADGLTLFIQKDVSKGYTVRTRQGQDVTDSVLPLISVLYNSIPSGYVLHAEGCLLKGGMLIPRVKANGLYNALFQGEPLPPGVTIHLKLLDMIHVQGFYSGLDTTPQRERYIKLCDVHHEFMKGRRCALSVEPVVSTIVYSVSEARTQVQRWIALQKWEGGVLKDQDAYWEDRKMISQMKLKNEFECSLRVVGHKPHSKHPEWVGSLLVESFTGADMIRTYVGSGLNEDASTMLDRRAGIGAFMGKIVEIKAECISKNYALQLPRITGVRIDKTEPDTFNQVVDAYNDSISLKE